jgi:hypothetical protein
MTIGFHGLWLAMSSYLTGKLFRIQLRRRARAGIRVTEPAVQ